MSIRTKFLRSAILTLSFAIFSAGIAWSVIALAQDGKHGNKQETNPIAHVQHMGHITTLAEAEALEPGDMIAMACSMCQHITLHHVGDDKSFLKLMTVGEKHECICGGTATVVGTGTGEGKDEKVTHECSTCGKGVMFVCATKAGSHPEHGEAKSKDDKADKGKGHQNHKKDGK